MIAYPSTSVELYPACCGCQMWLAGKSPTCGLNMRSMGQFLNAMGDCPADHDWLPKGISWYFKRLKPFCPIKRSIYFVKSNYFFDTNGIQVLFGGYILNGGTPIAGWFMVRPLRWMMTGGTRFQETSIRSCCPIWRLKMAEIQSPTKLTSKLGSEVPICRCETLRKSPCFPNISKIEHIMENIYVFQSCYIRKWLKMFPLPIMSTSKHAGNSISLGTGRYGDSQGDHSLVRNARQNCHKPSQ